MPVEQTASPLETIRIKERELARRLESTRRQADAQIGDAETQSAQNLDRVRESAAAEAQSALDKAIACADADAETIRSQAQSASLALKKRQQSLIGSFAEIVAAWVLPSGKVERGCSSGEESHAAPHGENTGHQHPPPS